MKKILLPKIQRNIKNNLEVIPCGLWKCVNNGVISKGVSICFISSSYWPDGKEVENEIYPGFKTCKYYEFYKKYSFEERRKISRKWKKDFIKPY